MDKVVSLIMLNYIYIFLFILINNLFVFKIREEIILLKWKLYTRKNKFLQKNNYKNLKIIIKYFVNFF